MHLRYKTWIIAPDGSRSYLGMFWTPAALADALARAGLAAGYRVEIECKDFGAMPEQCKPGSTREKMNGKPLKGKAGRT